MKGINLEYGYSSDLPNKIHLIKDAGFDSVLLYYDEHIDESIKLATDAGLLIDALHLPYKGMVNNIWQNDIVSHPYEQLLLACIDYAANYGIKDVVLHVSSTYNPPPLNECGIKIINNLLMRCEERGVYLCLENLRRLDYLQYIYKNCKSKKIAFCYDSGHANAFTHNLTNFPWQELASNLRCVHLHDNNGVSDQHLLPFDGNIPWDEVGRKLKQYCLTDKISLELHSNAKQNYSCTEQEFLKVCFDRLSRFYDMMRN